MKFTANIDLRDYAREIAEKINAAMAKTASELEKLDADAETKPEVIEKRREDVLSRYKDEAARIRAEYAGKIDLRINEIRKLSEQVKPTAINPNAAAVIQMITLAPSPSFAMFVQAAETVGNDAAGREVLMQLADKFGYAEQLTPYLPIPERHLQKSDLESIAEDMTASFRMFFDSHSEYPVSAGIDDVHVRGEEFLNAAQRSASMGMIQDIADGKGWTFGGESSVQSEFSALASAEI